MLNLGIKLILEFGFLLLNITSIKVCRYYLFIYFYTPLREKKLKFIYFIEREVKKTNVEIWEIKVGEGMKETILWDKGGSYIWLERTTCIYTSTVHVKAN